MFLTATNLFHYLRDAGLADADDVVERRFAVTEVGRRNRNFIVERAARGSLFVKQIPLHHPELTEAMRREAACAQLAHGGEAPTLAAVMPRLLRYDPIQHVLVTEFLAGHHNLSQHVDRGTPVDAVLAARLGALLATHHAETGRDGALAGIAPALKGEPPWVLRIVHDRGSVMPSMNANRRAVVEAIERHPEVCAGLQALREGWRRACLIHGDMKGDNVMVAPAAPFPDLRLIDWELADVGDPLWDAASALVLLLQPRLLDPANVSSGRPPTEILAGAFWSAYAGHTRSEADSPTLAWLGALVGARLILLAFELLPDGAAAPPQVEAVLSLARGCFADPLSALSRLFGIAPSTPGRPLVYAAQQTLRGRP